MRRSLVSVSTVALAFIAIFANPASAHGALRQIDNSHGGLEKCFRHRGESARSASCESERAGIPCVTHKTPRLKKRRCLATFVT